MREDHCGPAPPPRSLTTEILSRPGRGCPSRTVRLGGRPSQGSNDPTPPHQILQGEGHQLLLQGFHQSHLDGIGVVLRLAIGAQPAGRQGALLGEGEEDSWVGFEGERGRRDLQGNGGTAMEEGPGNQCNNAEAPNLCGLAVLQRGGGEPGCVNSGRTRASQLVQVACRCAHAHS